MESKKTESTHRAPRKTIIAILAARSAALTFAEDFKTVSGKEYKDATVSRVEPDGIALKSKSGISKVYFVELPKGREREPFRHHADHGTNLRHASTLASSVTEPSRSH